MINRRAAARFTDLIVEAGPDLLNYFERRVGESGADLLAELMAVAWRRNADIPGDAEQARMWLFGIARNLVRNNIRSSIRQARLADALRARYVNTQGVGTLEQIAIRDAVERLPAELAELVTLVHWDGFTIAEAGQIQGVPPSTARGRYQRAKEGLRALLAEQESRT